MLIATKGNREIRINKEHQEAFEKEGFLVYDSDTLELITKTAESPAVNEKILQDEIERLNGQVSALKYDIDALKNNIGFELTNNQLKTILKSLAVDFNDKDNKDTLQTLLLNSFNSIAET